MEFRHLKYFLALHQHKSFRRAAEAINIVQPALSQQIKKLEDMYGTQLFFREKTGVRLSPEGEAFLPHAQKILADVELAQALLRSLSPNLHPEQGQVNFGILVSLGMGAIDMPTVLEICAEKYQKMKVVVHEGTTESMYSDLCNGILDATFLDRALLPDISNVNYVDVAQEELVIFVGNEHPLWGVEEAELSAFANDKFIQIAAAGSAGRAAATADACQAAGFQPNFAIFPPNAIMACAAVADNIGVYVSNPWFSGKSMFKLHGVKLRGAPMTGTYSLLWSKDIKAPTKKFLQVAWPSLNFRSLAPQHLPFK